MEVTSQDGDEATVRLTGTMSMNVAEDDVEAIALALLEADMGELSEEDIDLMLPFMEMALTQSVPMDEELTVVDEDGEWLVCGGLGEAPDETDYRLRGKRLERGHLCSRHARGADRPGSAGVRHQHRLRDVLHLLDRPTTTAITPPP